MARPKSTVPTIYPKLRGSKYYVFWLFQGLQHREPTGLSGDAAHVGATGFLKTSHPDHLDTNQKLEAIIDRFKLATDILYKGGAGTVTLEGLRKEYDRLTEEDKQKIKRVEQAERARFVESIQHGHKQMLDDAHATITAKNERVRVAVRKALHIPQPAERLADANLSIEQLEAMLHAKKLERDNELRRLNQYDDDLLTAFITKYQTRNGKEATMENSSKRVLNSFIVTLNNFNPHWKIQDVTERTLIDFQDWLIDEDYANSTIENYTSKIKSVLNYYSDRPALLPSHVVITKDYKNYRCHLTQNPEQVIALTADEVSELLRFSRFKKKSWEKLRDMFVFQCATGCRISDVRRIKQTFIKNGHIEFTPYKTRKKGITVRIPLNPISTYILKKYDWDFTDLKVEDYYLNEQIKLICKEIGGRFNIKEQIVANSGTTSAEQELHRWQLVTSHVGRKTYATLRIAQGVPIPKVMGETGHTDSKTLMLYVDKHKAELIENPFKLPFYQAPISALPAPHPVRRLPTIELS